MAWQTLAYQLTSDCPMLMHNGQSADPLNKWAKLKKQVTAKRKKTDADQEELSRLDFLSSLYMGPDGPIIPSVNIDGMILNAAKKNREGPLAKSGVFCITDAPLQYEGPRTADELFADENFRHVAMVRVQQSRTPRTRPVFSKWSALVKVSIEDTIVNPKQVDDWFHIAGTQVGLGDWRPQHGRFTVTRLNDK